MFTIIEGAVAILRKPKGVYVQANMYYRLNSKSIYVKAAGGFIRIAAKFGDTWATSHPDYKVVEIDGFDEDALV